MLAVGQRPRWSSEPLRRTADNMAADFISGSEPEDNREVGVIEGTVLHDLILDMASLLFWCVFGFVLFL